MEQGIVIKHPGAEYFMGGQSDNVAKVLFGSLSE